MQRNHTRNGMTSGRYTQPKRKQRAVRAALCGLGAAGLIMPGLMATASPAAAAGSAVALYVASGGTGDCTSLATACGTLQAATTAAQTNHNGDDVTINVGAGTFVGRDTIAASALHSLSIVGAGASSTTADGNLNGSVFIVNSGTVTIRDLTITRGKNTSGNRGGGIDAKSAATLTVRSSTISGNTGSVDGTGSYLSGGGITAEGALTVDSSTISGNTGNYGGGIESGGVLTVNSSTISGNFSGGGGGGGGIDHYDYGHTSTVTVNSSTISGNTENYGGGGIGITTDTLTVNSSTISGNAGSSGGIYAKTKVPVIVNSSTISGNSASQVGGGISGAPITVNSSTISGNSSSSNGGGLYAITNSLGNHITVVSSTISGNSSGGHGGGIFDGGGFWNASPTAQVTATILANNTASGSASGCDGTIHTDGGYNISDDSTCGFTATGSVNSSTTLDASLGALADNGGPTKTILPSAPSPVIGAIPSGTAGLCPTTDQRGVALAAGVNCSIGSVQVVPPVVNVAPAITSAAATTFTKGSAGSFTVTATGTPTPTFSETGTLPTGVSFNSTSGVLSGTPTGSGSFPITMGAANGVGSNASQSFTLTVNGAPAITSADNATFTNGVAGSFTVTATGTPAPTFSETGTLPAGVSFNSTTGVLSGTPTASGSFSITMGATNGVGSGATQPFTLTVNAAPTITSGASKVFVKGVAGSFTVTATGYPAPTFSETGTLPTGITLNSSGVLSGTSTQTGSFPVTMTATNGVGTDATQNFTVNVVAAPVFTSANNATFTTAGSNSFTVSASGFPAPTFAVTTGTLPSGVTLNSTTGVLSGTPAATGVTSVTITATNAVSNATQSFTLTANAGPVITSANSTGFVATVAGTFTVTASGYPAPTFTETGALPAGITLNATTGVLSGTTTADGTYVIALKATNGVGSGGTQVFTLTVATAVPTFTSASSGTAVAGTPYSFTIRAIGASPITMSTASTSAITAAGLTFTDNGDGTATVAGTPLASAAGLKTWTWKAQNAAGKTLQGFNLAINLAPSITSAASKSVKTGVAFSMTITSKGFPVATLSATGLPAGVTLVDLGSGKGTLAGTMPAGVHTFTITASNGVLPDATQLFTLTGK